ncbi:HOG (high osmolarity glycerol) pathway protein [Blastocladiella emersonii ATCC 22665]|nr:HOG (high osmolarity glycerol) pathway protein [Blastocladiella emersonii ATCC 22665]
MSSECASPLMSPLSRKMKTLSIASTVPFKVRDFAHPPTSPLHFGVYPITSPTPSTTSDIDNLFPCHARAMYDFEAQDPSELSFAEGALIYILERKYPGWLLGILGDDEGLVPENYVCIEDDTSENASEAGGASAGSRPVSGVPPEVAGAGPAERRASDAAAAAAGGGGGAAPVAGGVPKTILD